MVNASKLFKADEEEQQTGQSSGDQIKHAVGGNGNRDPAVNSGSPLKSGKDIANGEQNPGFYRSEAENDTKAVPANELNAGEKTAGSRKDTANPSASLSDEDGKFSGDETPSTWRSRINLKSRKGIAGLLITAAIGGGGFFGISTASGPLQAIHASQVLSHSFSKNDQDSAIRTKQLFRFARAVKSGDVADTRLSGLGSKVFGSTLDQLEKSGVTIERGPSGSPIKTNIDIDKLQENYPELKGASAEDAKAFIADKLGITADQVEGAGSKFSISEKDFDLKTARLLTTSTVGLLDDGGIVSAIKSRYLTEGLHLPSLFHPLDRAAASQENKLLNKTTPEEEKAEEEREGKLTEAIEGEGDSAVSDIEEKSSTFSKGLSSTLLISGGVCIAYSTADDIITVNKDRVVLPSVIHALDIMAVGSQAQTGIDVSSAELGAVVSGFSKDGKSIWQAQALQNLAEGSDNKKLADIPTQYKQAFSGATKASAIKAGANNFFSKASGGTISAGAACSPAGLIIQGGITLFAGAVSAFGDAASGGTLTPGLVAIWGAKEAAEVAASAVATHYIQSFILNKTTAAKLAVGVFSTPDGGNLIAYGSRAAANIVAISSGGLDLGNKASTVLAANEQAQENKQFRSETLYARLFDTSDYRSLTGRLADSINPGVGQNVLASTNSLLNIGSSLASTFSSLLPHASAASDDSSYDWGFSQYGLPDTMLNDPQLADPYANAADAVTALQGASGSTYISRAKTCFGTDISQDSAGVWDSTATTEVNTADSSYTDANCNNISDLNWERIVMFVFDTNTMKSAACYEGDDQSCTEMGLGGGNSATTPTAPTTGDLSKIDQTTMYQDSSNVPCATGTVDAGIHAGYHNGQQVPIRLCGIPNIKSSSSESHGGFGSGYSGGDALINSRVSANFLALATTAAKDGVTLSANSSFRTMAHQESLCPCNGVSVARPGYSNHQMGLAIDFSVPFSSGGSCSGNRSEAKGNAMWDWLDGNSAAYGIKQYGYESWHWDTLDDASRCGGDGNAT